LVPVEHLPSERTYLNADIISRLRDKSKQSFYGWRIVTATFFINAFGIGTFFYGFSTFFNPLIAEFGWSRTLMSGVFSLSRLEGGIEGPVIGWLTDRFGARRLLFVGITISGIGFIVLRMVNSPISLYLIFLFVLSMGYNIGYTHATSAAVAKWFVKKRGRALSILLTGNGVGGAIFVPVIAWLIVQYDWRVAAIIIGIATLLIPLPLALIVRSTPEEMGLQPDGEETKRKDATSEPDYSLTSPTSNAPPDEVDFTVREALKTRAFWMYAISMILRSCILSAIVVHQIPHLTDIGIPYQTASNVLGLMVLMSIPGRFIFGWLGDRFNKRSLLFVSCVLQGIGIFIFINATVVPLLYVFVVVYGLGYGGAIPLTVALRADLFGRKNYATIAGISMSLAVVGTVSAPLFAGYLYDTTNSYSLAFYIFIAMIVLSGFFFLMIPRTTQPVRQT
jgi:sugar phosphate permease